VEKKLENIFIKKWINNWIDRSIRFLYKIDNVKWLLLTKARNKEKIKDVLDYIKVKIKVKIWNFNYFALTQKTKFLLWNIWIIRKEWVNSKFLNSWIEVLREWKRKLDMSDWGIKIYYIRFIVPDQNPEKIDSDKHMIFLKKAVYKDWKLFQNTHIAKLGNFSWYQHLYKMWFDMNNPPEKNYNRLEHSYYKWTEFSWIRSNSIAYVSKSLPELQEKLKNHPTWKFAVTPKNSSNFWANFESSNDLVIEIWKIPSKLNIMK
jgi:hypothetical protein